MIGRFSALHRCPVVVSHYLASEPGIKDGVRLIRITDDRQTANAIDLKLCRNKRRAFSLMDALVVNELPEFVSLPPASDGGNWNGGISAVTATSSGTIFAPLRHAGTASLPSVHEGNDIVNRDSLQYDLYNISIVATGDVASAVFRNMPAFLSASFFSGPGNSTGRFPMVRLPRSGV
jgi:hypothetical protein